MPPISRRRDSAPLNPARARGTAPPASLAELHKSRVAAHIVVQGREQFVRGTAYYEADTDMGAALRVLVNDPDGNFEIVVAESRWDGKILPGQAVGCDYLIRLQ